MASEQLFEAYPPFPGDVPTARLSRFSLKKLVTGNEAEAQEVYQACRTKGFFLLDLQDDSNGEKLLQDIGRLFGITMEVMALGLEEKIQYKSNPPTNLLG
jgi:hypothetical protein